LDLVILAEAGIAHVLVLRKMHPLGSFLLLALLEPTCVTSACGRS
jgi:hypothetical protein